MPANPKPPPLIRDRRHLAFVASLPCCITGRTDGVQVHHLLRVPEKCCGRRSGDNHAIPLHHEKHTALHRDGNEQAYLTTYDIDGPALAKALYEASGKYELACKAIQEARER